MTAASGRLLSLSANTLLPARWASPVRVYTSGLTAAIAAALAWASLQFVVSQRQGGNVLALGIPRWADCLLLPIFRQA